MIRLFVGLGNPGPAYEGTRHNAGFWWVDALAARLGARRVWAVDIDPQALLASDDNADGNGVEDRIELATPAELPAKLSVDILLANILAGVLVRLAPEFARRVKPGGRLILSGILEQHANAVQAAFTRNFAFKPARQREDWMLLEGKRIL